MPASTQRFDMPDASSLTTLLRRAAAGDADAYGAVFEAAYDDLKRLAHTRLRRCGAGDALDTTGLVHESYLRFVNAAQLDLADRRHFFAYAGRVMRSVIVDMVRASMAQRRSGDATRVTLNTSSGAADGEELILAVHEALTQMATVDERMARVVEMRYFGGLTHEEIAETLQITDRTVRRLWSRAKLWLAEALD